MEHLSAERQQRRWRATVEAALKIFVGAFLWQGFGLACKCSVHYTGYYFLTGFGSGLGTLVSALFPYVVTGFKDFKPVIEGIRGAMLGLAVFLGPGTIWQRVVNDSADWNFSFTGGFFYMWPLSGLMFLASMTVLRFLASRIQRYFFDHRIRAVESVTRQFLHDACLAFSVGLGDAFFMGTSAEQFPTDNWLAPAFGVYNSTDPFVAMLLAGISTMIGFLIAQTFQNIVFPDCWADNTEDLTTLYDENEHSKDGHSLSSKDALELPASTANPMNAV